jgi:3'-phosphoadenosine 5'-phosphosulfate sulfotransferase (PAPS reductase)/FAD synthetase
VIHYHGTPVTPRSKLLELAGRCFCVSFAHPYDVTACHEIGQAVMLDNGAFSFWRTGRPVDWPAYYAWCERWLEYQTTWAVIPDVIDGTVRENDRLLDAWPFGDRGAPVWHMHEPIRRLLRLAGEWPRVCIGSSQEYRSVASPRWHQRMTQAMDALCPNGPAPVWLHMLRGLRLAGSHYPFSSADSTNVARNHAGCKTRGIAPRSPRAMAERIDSRQCSSRWHTTASHALPRSARAHRRPGRVDPDELIAQARGEHQPVAVWCLFSGGNDSTVLAHRCREHYQGLAWIDTGTAVPGVAEFVGEYAQWIGKPLRVLHAGDAFRVMVLGDLVWWARFIAAHDREPGLSIEAFIARDEREHGRASGGELGQVPHGFPGPGAHGRAYNRLKERQIMTLLRESKQGHPRSARVLLLSGIRRAESQRRARREAINRLGSTSAVFANPLIDWTNEDMRRYRSEHGLPQSPAAALLHRSGECNCGAFANANGERAMLASLYPEFFAGIEALEAKAHAAGVRWCRWGGYDVHGNRAGEVTRQKPGMLCESCESRQHSTATRGRSSRRRAAGCPADGRGGRP